VLKAAEAHEIASVDAAVATCSECASLVEDHRRIASLLGLAVPPAQPSGRAKQALFARIEATAHPSLATSPQLPATLTLPSSKGFLQPIPEGWSPAAPVGKSRRSRFRPNWSIIATPLATVPLMLALGIVGLWAMNTNAQLNDKNAQVQTLNMQVSQLNSQVTTLNSSLAQVDNFQRAGDAKTYDITGTDGASGQVIANPGTAEARILVQGMTERLTTYDVFVETNAGSLVPVGKVTVNNEGKGTTVLNLNQPFASYKSVHVRPAQNDGSYSASDTDVLSTPDMLSAEIEPNVGRSDDTDGSYSASS
jgi:hypothetical protein